jgi:acetylornithine deacetylase/succinyl-diaminopimelate desuccinylase-like protein
MEDYLEKVVDFVEQIKAIQEVILTNIVLIGQIPAPTFKERKRAEFFLDRLSEFQVDECSSDEYHNPIGIIRGTVHDTPPIFVVAHLDTFFKEDIPYHYTLKKKYLSGPGLLDNSVGVGVLVSLPEIFRALDLRFKSDIVLAGVVQSIGRGNLRGMRSLLKTWPGPIRGAVCIEGFELGRLNYFSDGMIRCEIDCVVDLSDDTKEKRRANAILILNEVINQTLQLSLPQRPRTKIVIGKISGGFNHGKIAPRAKLGFEVRSDSDDMLKSVFGEIKDIVDGIDHEHDVSLKLKTVSNLRATRLQFNHPLVKSAAGVIKNLGIKPVGQPTESELSIFLSHGIPAVTLGISRGKHMLMENATMEIEPMFKGIAQIIGVIMAIDSGVCDG